jgi:hypothetical protein
VVLLCTARLIGRGRDCTVLRGSHRRAAGNSHSRSTFCTFRYWYICGAIGFYDWASLLQFFLVLLGVCGVVALFTPTTSIFKTVIKEKLTRGLASLEWGDGKLPPRPTRSGHELL